MHQTEVQMEIRDDGQDIYRAVCRICGWLGSWHGTEQGAREDEERHVITRERREAVERATVRETKS